MIQDKIAHSFDLERQDIFLQDYWHSYKGRRALMNIMFNPKPLELLNKKERYDLAVNLYKNHIELDNYKDILKKDIKEIEANKLKPFKAFSKSEILKIHNEIVDMEEYGVIEEVYEQRNNRFKRRW